MKITIVDIINMLAKGEETPKYIRYFNKVQSEWLVMLVGKENIIARLNENAIFLNDEVDIIKEEKEIEKLNLDTDELLKNVVITAQDYVIEGKINELIDAVNELKRGN